VGIWSYDRSARSLSVEFHKMEILENQKFWSRVNVGLVILGLMVGLVFQQWPDNKLRLIFCDVGQGDASLITFGSYQMLVDGGPNNSVLSCLGKNMPFWDKKIEVVAMTHSQADHMMGLIEVFERYEVEQFLASNVVNDTPEFWQLRKVVLEKEIKTKDLVKGDELRLGAVKLKVLWPKEKGDELLVWHGVEKDRQVLGAKSFQGDVNKVSLVLKGSLGKFDFLLTGDINKKIEGELEVGEVEILKVAHHGSRYSSSEEFLKKINPEVAVISVGERNWFGHPTQTVLDRLGEIGARVLRTDEDGMVKIVSDGKNWWQE